MRIVDAQIHLWGSGLPSNMAHRQVTSFTTEEALGLMDEGGVDAAVIHPPGWDPNSTEMAIHLGRRRAGTPGLLVAGACFILPAMLIVIGLAWRLGAGSLPTKRPGCVCPSSVT